MRRGWPFLALVAMAAVGCSPEAPEELELVVAKQVTADEIHGPQASLPDLEAAQAPESEGTGEDLEEVEPVHLMTVAEEMEAESEFELRFDRVSDHYTRVREFGGRSGGCGGCYGVRRGCGRRAVALTELRVVYEDGSPAVGVELLGKAGELLGTVDAAGIARGVGGIALQRGQAGGTWVLDGRRLYVKAWVDRGYADGVGTIALWSAGRALLGQCVDQFGTPVAGATLTITGVETHHVETDALGRFRLPDTTPNRLTLELEHPECFRHPMPDWIDQGAPGPVAVTVTAVRGEAHLVRVTDDGQAPMDGARVEYGFQWPQPVDGRQPSWTYDATADASGLARILVVPGHELRASVEHKGFPSRRVIGLAGTLPTQLDVQLRKGRADTWVPVRCRDARSGMDVRPTRVVVRRVEQPWIVGDLHTWKTERAICHRSRDADPETDLAVCDLEDLPSGLWEIWMWAPGHAPVVVTGEASEGGIYPPVDVQLPQGAPALRVTVTDLATAAPIDDVRVSATPVAGQGAFLHPERFNVSAITAGGIARLDLPPGEYTITTRLRGYANATQRILVGPGGAPAAFALTRE